MKAISCRVDLCRKTLDACLTVIRETDGIGLPQVTPDRMRAGTVLGPSDAVHLSVGAFREASGVRPAHIVISRLN